MEIEKIPVKIDYDFTRMVGNFCELKKTTIRVVDIRTSTKIIYGYIRVFQNKIDIGINENLNYCWTRFVTCKELSHILLGNNGNGRTTNPKILINGLYEKLVFGNKTELDHEHFAVFCAAEIMMPYIISQPMLKNNTITSIDIAKKFMLPLYIVQVYRNPTFLEEREKIYSSLK